MTSSLQPPPAEPSNGGSRSPIAPESASTAPDRRPSDLDIYLATRDVRQVRLDERVAAFTAAGYTVEWRDELRVRLIRRVRRPLVWRLIPSPESPLRWLAYGRVHHRVQVSVGPEGEIVIS